MPLKQWIVSLAKYSQKSLQYYPNGSLLKLLHWSSKISEMRKFLESFLVRLMPTKLFQDFPLTGWRIMFRWYVLSHVQKSRKLSDALGNSGIFRIRETGMKKKNVLNLYLKCTYLNCVRAAYHNFFFNTCTLKSFISTLVVHNNCKPAVEE